jgi:RimJ/RimL family protein N-acetyltransferase
MPTPIEITTQRLHLRQWSDADREPYAAMNADPVVMRFFAGTLPREASDRDIDAWRAQLDDRGWSNWAVEIREGGRFIGFTGLSIPGRALPFMPCVELGYRLAREHWGKGYATEGAKAALRVGFELLCLDEIVSFTSLVNLPSRAVMERVGMANANEDFDHPALPEGSELRKHCLYRLRRENWRRYTEDPRKATGSAGPGA